LLSVPSKAQFPDALLYLLRFKVFFFFYAFSSGENTKKRTTKLRIQCHAPDEDERDEEVNEQTPFLWSGRNQPEINRKAHVIKAVLYALQNFYAFMLM
jgi:hypothetical protein